MKHQLSVIFWSLTATLVCAISVAQDKPANTLSREPSNSASSLVKQKRIYISGIISDVVQARRGRILALVLGKEKLLAIFDCEAQRVVKTIPLPSVDVIVAGTLDHLIIADRIGSTFEQWSLDTFTMEVSKKSPFGGEIIALAAGSATQGPILLRHRIRRKDQQKSAVFAAMQLHTLAPASFSISHTASAREPSQKTALLTMRAAPNGQFFTVWHPSDYLEGFFTVTCSGKSLNVDYLPTRFGYELPSADGRYIFTAFKGALSEGKVPPSDRDRQFQSCVPTSHAQFYLTTPSAIEMSKSEEEMRGKDRPQLYELGNSVPLLSLPKIDFEMAQYAIRGVVSLDASAYWVERRLFYYLPSNLVVAVPHGDDALILNSFDLAQELKRVKVDHLYVSSVPNQEFEAGQEYHCQMKVESNGASPQYELLVGPKGMAISKDGLVTWAVPAKYDHSSEEVSISVVNEQGRKCLEGFTIYKKRDTVAPKEK